MPYIEFGLHIHVAQIFISRIRSTNCQTYMLIQPLCMVLIAQTKSSMLEPCGVWVNSFIEKVS